MAIKINFDLGGNPETPTLILATRDGNKLGQIEAKEIELSEKLIGASEITFIVNKYVDGRLTNLWDKIVDFKLVHCQEWDVWFEIRVEIDEDTKTVKTVFCTQLAQAELSQLMLYNIEINTEADIARDDYEISVLYNPDNPEASILHRLFEKAPHYSFGHVAGTIVGMQRSFSFDDVSIYDALQEIAEEIGCLFVFHSGTDINGEIERYIAIYDLEQCCGNVPVCGYRGEFTEVCPKCGSTTIVQGYGEDTNIFVTADELASNNIQFTTDTDSVKNCFKLEAGDDLMTATIRNCNPNGTDYIWYFSDSIKADMSQALRDKLAAYDAMYQNYQVDYNANLDSTLVNRYNSLVNKYKSNNSQLKNIDDTSVKGYSNLMNAYYNVVDLSLYLESGMMPTVSMSNTTAVQEAAKLTSTSLSPLAVTKLKNASRETVNSVALGMAKILVKPTYKVEINGTPVLDDYVEGATTLTWSGRFTVTNYSDEEDTYTTGTIDVRVNDKAEDFTKQKIEKALNKEDTEDYSVVGLFKKSIHTIDIGIVDCDCAFCEELKKYALKPLISFRDACQACIDILIEQGATKDDLYNNLYFPYWLRLKAIEKEIKVREDEISDIDGIYDDEGNLIKKGLASEIEKVKSEIQEALNFEKFLRTGTGEDLWHEFCSYRREDKYKNENYISDGLDNAELFTRALEFIDVAENEIYKSSELQHSISSTLKNLMVVEKFKPFVDYFEVGNWMRVQLDDSVYKLRLLEYTIDFDNIGDIAVVFSDVSKVRNGLSDLEDLFSQASSMTSHYESVKKQASKGQVASGTIEQWLQDGLNSALVQINNNNSEEVTITENGILCRSYDISTDSYSNEQLKLTHNILAYTNDDWKTVRQAVGKHLYKVYDAKANGWIADIGYGMSADFVTAGYLTSATIVGGAIYSSNYSNGIGDNATPMGTYINLQTGEFEIGGRKLVYNANDDKLTLSGVTIEWSNTNKPDITNISGFDDYIDKLNAIETQVDNKAETWYQATDPSANWTTNDLKDEHIGDLWYYTGNTGVINGSQRSKGSEWIWQNVSGAYKWCEMDVSDEVYDLIDGKSSIYTALPLNPEDGDLLIPSSNIGTQYKAGQVYKYNATTQTWVEISYATNTAVNKAQDVADAAAELGNELVNVLGYDGTKIYGTYLYSPVISGGSLLMGNKNGIYAEITTDGILNAKGANITGNITADSLIINNNATFGGIITSNSPHNIQSTWNLNNGEFSVKSEMGSIHLGDLSFNMSGNSLHNIGTFLSLNYNSDTICDNGVIIHSFGTYTETPDTMGMYSGYSINDSVRSAVIKFLDINATSTAEVNNLTYIDSRRLRTKEIQCQSLNIGGDDIRTRLLAIETRLSNVENGGSGGTTYTINVYSADDDYGSVSGSGTYPAGETISLIATPKYGYTFSHWYIKIGHTVTFVTRDNPYTFTPSNSETYYAYFEEEPDSRTVTVADSSMGKVTIYYDSDLTQQISSSNNVYTLLNNHIYRAYAEAYSGYTFDGWTYTTQSGQTYTIGGNPLDIAIDAVEIQARFKDVSGGGSGGDDTTYYTITLASTDVNAGTIYINGVAANATQTHSFAKGTYITIYAEANDGYKFINWYNKNGIVTSYSSTLCANVPIIADMFAGANFEQVESGGSSGGESEIVTIKIKPNDYNKGYVAVNGYRAYEGEDSFEFNIGDSVTIQACPDGDYQFNGWMDYDDGSHYWAKDNPCTFTVSSSTPIHIRAMFS